MRERASDARRWTLTAGGFVVGTTVALTVVVPLIAFMAARSIPHPDGLAIAIILMVGVPLSMLVVGFSMAVLSIMGARRAIRLGYGWGVATIFAVAALASIGSFLSTMNMTPFAPPKSAWPILFSSLVSGPLGYLTVMSLLLRLPGPWRPTYPIALKVVGALVVASMIPGLIDLGMKAYFVHLHRNPELLRQAVAADPALRHRMLMMTISSGRESIWDWTIVRNPLSYCVRIALLAAFGWLALDEGGPQSPALRAVPWLCGAVLAWGAVYGLASLNIHNQRARYARELDPAVLKAQRADWRRRSAEQLARDEAKLTTVERFYRIDVALDTPQGEAKGSGVMRLRANGIDKIHGRGFSAVKGEAIPIKLPNGAYVFMLDDVPFTNWEMAAPWVGDWDMYDLEHGKTVPMETKRIPGLAAFGDLRNPRTVRHIDLNAEDETGEAHTGYSVRSATLTRVDGPETHDLEGIMPWIARDDLMDDDFLPAGTPSWTPRDIRTFRASNFRRDH